MRPVRQGTNGQSGEQRRGQPSDGNAARTGDLVAERYRVERLIGRGGMASVYAAHDTRLERDVALKIFRPELADRDDMRRHEGEVRMLAGLNHPGLVTLFDAVADDDGAAVLVLELVGGGDLRAVLDAGSVPPADIALIGATIAEALAYSHERGIVHRDVKPANILLPMATPGATGSPAKLADFGIARLVDEARLTAIGSIIGTAHYLSPEQALGGAVGPASDVYSLGLVLLEAVGGQRPHPGTGVEAVAARLASDPALPAGFRPDWAELVRGMTDRDPETRTTAADAAVALRRIAEDPAPAVDATSAARDDATALMPTALLPPETQRATTRLSTQPQSTQRPAVDTAATEILPGRVPQPVPVVTRPARSRALLIGIVAAAVLVVSGGIAAGVQISLATAPSADIIQQPEYPVVEGELGDHLRQLQESVAP